MRHDLLSLPSAPTATGLLRCGPWTQLRRAALTLALVAASGAGVATVSGCSKATIGTTNIIDTPENRSVLAALQALRDAMQNRDEEALVALISRQYFEDMGTNQQEDDYGYEKLVTIIIPQSLNVAEEVHVAFEVHAIDVSENRAQADIRYASRAKLDLPSGTLWDSHKDFNRIVFAREDGAWRVISGL